MIRRTLDKIRGSLEMIRRTFEKFGGTFGQRGRLLMIIRKDCGGTGKTHSKKEGSSGQQAAISLIKL
jgi:hypothetical protein